MRSVLFMGFGPSRTVNGRRLSMPVFGARSCLPLSAACAVANGVRETLASLVDAPVSLHVVEPMIPDPQTWRALTAQARLYRARGPVCEAAFVLRAADALALAAGAFGETTHGARPLSAIEDETLDRVAEALTDTLAHLCGPATSRTERILDIAGFVTYFELIVERPVQARIGVALSRDPLLQSGATLNPGDLADVEVELSVECARGHLDAQSLLDLRPGARVPMMTRIGDPGLLKAGAVLLARGECGALGERSAFAVTAPK